jgi:PAS domain S-box-containing protein
MRPHGQSGEKMRVAPRSVGKSLSQIAIVFAVQFAAGKLGDDLALINSGGIGPVWPASGVALAALLLFGYQVWPGVAAGAFLLAFLSPIPHIAAAVYAAGTTLAALTGTFLLRCVVNFDNSLSRLRDALGMIVFGAISSSVVSATVGASVLYAVHLRGWSGFGRAWLIYWLGDSMGVLLVTPLVLTFPSLLTIRPRIRSAEFTALLLLLTVACFVIFGELPLVPVRLHVLAFAVLPFVMWATIRFGVSGATLSTLFVAAIATVETALGSGPFAQNTPFTNAVLLDVFFGVISVSGMTLAAVIAEREQAEREREQLVREQAAMEARLRLANIVESSNDAIIGTDMDGIITDWNNGAARLYGYPAGEVIGELASLLIPPDRANEFGEIMGALKRGDTVKHYETVRLKKDGTRIEVSLTMSPIREADGGIVGASVIIRDVCERKRQETLLRESEERLRVAAEVGRMYAWEWNPATDSVRRSAECANILGLSDASGEGIAKDYLAFIHPDDRAELQSLVDALTPEDPVYRTHYRRFHADGALLWLEENGSATFDGDGKMVRLVGMTADITERKQAQETLRESEEKFRSVFREAGVGMVIVSPDGRFLAANKAFCDSLGYTEEELIEKTVESVTLSEDWPAFSKKLREALTEGRGFQWFEKRCLHKSGRIVYTASSASLIQSRNGEPQYFVGEVLDVTMRKEAERALADMARKLIAAQEQERTRIARELHDDINQRLAMLAIELEKVQNDPSEIQQRISELRKQTTEISNDVQALSHDLHSSQLEYLGAVAGMKNWCKEFGERQGMQIDCRQDVRSTLPQEIGLCLFRVLQEALHNAAKHSGGKRTEVQLHEESDEIHLTIRDLGKGFDVEAAKQGRG